MEQIWSKFGDPTLTGWWVIARTNLVTEGRTDVGNDNTRRPIMALGKNCSRVVCGKNISKGQCPKQNLWLHQPQLMRYPCQNHATYIQSIWHLGFIFWYIPWNIHTLWCGFVLLRSYYEFLEDSCDHELIAIMFMKILYALSCHIRQQYM